MNNRILVLGATGNIGSRILRILKERGADFLGGVPPSELTKLEDAGVKGVAADFNDPASLERAMKGVDTLFMLLPMAEPMLGWAENILNAVKAAGVAFIVRSSLIHARSDSEYFLYQVHGKIDDMVRGTVPFAIVHPNSFMQNYVNYYRDAIVNQDAVYHAYGDARLSAVDVRDIAAVDAEILMDPERFRGREFTLTGPEALTQYEIADILSEVTGRKITYRPLSFEEYEKNLRAMHMPDWYVKANMSFQYFIAGGRAAEVTEDVEKVAKRRPLDFRAFARDNAGAWRKAPVHA